MTKHYSLDGETGSFKLTGHDATPRVMRARRGKRGGRPQDIGDIMETENLKGKKLSVKGGGVCIYCGWNGGEQGLHDEHAIPYSLGGSTELLNASCSDCDYMANAIFGHLRVHIGLQSRSGHPDSLPTTIELADGQRAVDLATENHPYFLNMPIWRPPGFMTGKQISDGFGESGRFTYWYVPPNLRDVIGLRDGDVGRIIDTSRPHNLNAFARGLAKIAYCNAVMKYGLDGFRPLVLRTSSSADFRTLRILWVAT